MSKTDTVTTLSKEEILTQFCLELAPQVGEILHEISQYCSDVILTKLEQPTIKIVSDYKSLGTHYLLNLLNILVKDNYEKPHRTYH